LEHFAERRLENLPASRRVVKSQQKIMRALNFFEVLINLRNLCSCMYFEKPFAGRRSEKSKKSADFYVCFEKYIQLQNIITP